MPPNKHPEKFCFFVCLIMLLGQIKNNTIDITKKKKEYNWTKHFTPMLIIDRLYLFYVLTQRVTYHQCEA